MKKDAAGLLAGIRVLDLADEQGSFCAKLLADLGATVIKIEKPHPPRASRSFRYHNLNKLGATLDLEGPQGKKTFQSLIGNADVLIESFIAGSPEARQLADKQLERIHPRLIHLTITGFGRTGPKCAYRSCDSVAAAFGGQMFCTGITEGKPLKLFGPQSSHAASLFGANAVLLSLRQREATGRGRHIDLSVQEAVASTLDHVMINYFGGPGMPGSPADDAWTGSFVALPCKDGYIEVPLLRDAETILELVNSEAMPEKRLGEEWSDAAYRNMHHRAFFNAAASWTARHTRKELFQLGQAMGLPWGPVQSPGEVLRSEQLKARRFLVQMSPARKRRPILTPNLPYKFSCFSPDPPKPAPLPGEHTKQVLDMFATSAGHWIRCRTRPRSSQGCGKILNGIRVLDFTRMLSGPYATRILGDFGAEVIKVQSRLTASGAERNDSRFFGAWNRNKRSIGVNLNHPGARDILLEMTSISDIVVENFSPRVLANWRLTYSHLKAIKPDLIMASISAMGQTGPWKNFVGYADTFHALSGLLHETSQTLDHPAVIGYAFGDVIAGLYASLAVLSCLEYRDRTGKGQHVDLSAYEALCTLLGPAFLEHSSIEKARANSSCEPENWGCYPCAGRDRWCVIAISSQAEWQKLCKVSKLPKLNRAKFSAWSRKGNVRKGLDRRIAQWTANIAAEAVVRRLQRAGVSAAVVQGPEDLAKDPHLAARNFFVHAKHPKFGTCFGDRSALWPWDENCESWTASPELGEANHYAYVELLGHTEAEFQKMLDGGILERG